MAHPRRPWYRRRWVTASAAVAAMVLIGPLLLPLTGAPGTVPPEELAGPDSRWADVAGIRIHYEDYGAGDPVLLLLHGFGASTFSWREVVESLAAAGRVIAFDRPGFGLSERPMPGDWLAETPYSADAYASLTVGLLDVLGVERAVLVGHSAGGAVAALTALTHPERVVGLVLVAPALGSGHGLPEWLCGLAATPQMRRIGPRLVRRMTGRLEGLLELAWHDRSRITAAIWAGYRRPLEALNWDRALWEIILAPQAAASLDARLPELAGLPVLYITGDDDQVVPTNGTIGLAGLAPPGADVQLVVVPQCGHLPQEEAAEEFLAAVRTFLARVSAAGQ